MAKKEKEREEAYSDALTLNENMKPLRNKGLSVPSLIGTVKLKAEVTAIATEYNTALGAIMDKYGIVVKQTPNGQVYHFVGHEKQVEIQKDVEDLLKQPIKLKSKLRFMSWGELQASMPEESIDKLVALVPWLVKDEN